jgi:hypothetical protein
MATLTKPARDRISGTLKPTIHAVVSTLHGAVMADEFAPDRRQTRRVSVGFRFRRTKNERGPAGRPTSPTNLFST